MKEIVSSLLLSPLFLSYKCTISYKKRKQKSNYFIYNTVMERSILSENFTLKKLNVRYASFRLSGGFIFKNNFQNGNHIYELESIEI